MGFYDDLKKIFMRYIERIIKKLNKKTRNEFQVMSSKL